MVQLAKQRKVEGRFNSVIFYFNFIYISSNDNSSHLKAGGDPIIIHRKLQQSKKSHFQLNSQQLFQPQLSGIVVPFFPVMF